jgi:hypothetical protein
MSSVPQGTADLIAHIFQPSLRDFFDFGPMGTPGLTSWATFHAVPSGLHRGPGEISGLTADGPCEYFGCCPNGPLQKLSGSWTARTASYLLISSSIFSRRRPFTLV